MLKDEFYITYNNKDNIENNPWVILTNFFIETNTEKNCNSFDFVLKKLAIFIFVKYKTHCALTLLK